MADQPPKTSSTNPNIQKSSILKMQLSKYNLSSLSHCVKLGNCEYFLVEMIGTGGDYVYMWEEVGVVKAVFGIGRNRVRKYQMLGGELEKFTNWPQSKIEALEQIRQKFYQDIQNQPQPQYYFEDQLQELIKQTNVQVQDTKGKNENSKNVQRSFQFAQEKQEDSDSLAVVLDSSEQMPVPRKFQQQSQFSDSSHQNPFKIKKIKVNRKKNKRITYIIRFRSGQSKQISSNRLKQRYLDKVIEFLQEQLKIKK